MRAAAYGVVAEASGAARVTGLLIDGNIFAALHAAAVNLDSVANAVIVNNIDESFGTAGFASSWFTTSTFGNGSYYFDNNRWAAAVPALYHAASTYRFGNDSGATGRNKGASAAAAATTLVVNHGCFAAPSKITATPSLNTGVFWVNTITATQFTLNWVTNSSPTWYWDAEI